MSDFFEATIEEYEQASWVADLLAPVAFDGSFSLPDGSTWTGTKSTERYDGNLFHTRVVGGQAKLGTVLGAKFYSGNVSLQVAAGDVCTEAGEKVGSIPSGMFLNTFQRQSGSASSALDALASAFGLIWWIGRDGLVSMSVKRPVGAEANGVRISSDVDASIVLSQPEGVTLGAAYDTAEPLVSMPVIRHVRWKLMPDKFEAQLYPIPFLFSNPVQTFYDRHYDAVVESDNGDGTISVFADAGRRGKFGVSKAKLFCGVPGAKVTVQNGDEVTLGFLGGNPQAPYCVSMAQDGTATKKVARNTDPIIATLSATDITALAAMLKVGAGPAVGSTIVATPSDLPLSGTCQINGGTSRISVGD